MKKFVLIGIFASYFSLLLPAQSVFVYYPEDTVVISEEKNEKEEVSTAATQDGGSANARSINNFVSAAFGASRNVSPDVQTTTAPQVDPAFASLSPQQQINAIKMENDVYLFAESTTETWEAALDNAKCLLNIEIENYVKSVGLKDSVVGVIARACNKMMQLKAMRGSRYRAFVYVKKAELIPYLAGEEVMIVSVANNNQIPAFDPAKADEEARMKESLSSVAAEQVAATQAAQAAEAAAAQAQAQAAKAAAAQAAEAERQRIAAAAQAAERQRIAAAAQAAAAQAQAAEAEKQRIAAAQAEAAAAAAQAQAAEAAAAQAAEAEKQRIAAAAEKKRQEDAAAAAEKARLEAAAAQAAAAQAAEAAAAAEAEKQRIAAAQAAAAQAAEAAAAAAAEKQRIAAAQAAAEQAAEAAAAQAAAAAAAEKQRIAAAAEKKRQEDAAAAAEKARLETAKLTDMERDMLAVTVGADIGAFVKRLSKTNAIQAYGTFKDMPENMDCLLFVYNRDKEIVAYLRKTGNTYFNLQTKQTDSITNYKGCGAIWFQPK